MALKSRLPATSNIYKSSPHIHLNMPAQPKYVSQLTGKKVVVIGGSSGIGFAVASALVEEGASVVIASSNQSRVDAAVERLVDPEQQYNADKSRVKGLTVNLKGEQMESSLNALFKSVGEFDHLIHSAGDPLAITPLEQISYSSILSAGEVRFFSVILAVKAARPYLRAGGSIILTTGSVSIQPHADWPIVAGYAGGLLSLGRQLAFDLSKYQLRVNVVSPGAVETELWDGIPEQQRGELFHELSKKMLTGKIGQPQEVAQTYLALLKDSNATATTNFTDAGAIYGPRPG